MRHRFQFVVEMSFDSPGDFSVVCERPFDLLDAVLAADNVCGRMVCLVRPQPGYPEGWPHALMRTSITRVPFNADAEELDRLCGSLWRYTADEGRTGLVSYRELLEGK